MEHSGPTRSIAEPLCGASVPSQHDHRQPAPHRPSGQGSEPAARAPRPTAHHAPTQPAPAQWYDCNIDKHVAMQQNS